MRIVLCKGQLYGPISGSDETLVTYASQLQQAGHSVSVLLMYLHTKEDQYYQRLLKARVPVSWIASNLANSSVGAGLKLAYGVLETFPGLKPSMRRKAQRIAAGLAKGYYGKCRDFLETQKPDLIHVMTPDPSAEVMIRAGHDLGIPVIYQELGVPFQPPDFESYYRQFATVLPLCSEIAALSPRLIEHCRQVLSAPRALSVMPIMSEELVNGTKSPVTVEGRVTFGFAARMEELKGTMVLMEAFGKAYSNCKNIFLSMAGDGSQRQKVATSAKALKVDSGYEYYGVYETPEDRRSFMYSLDIFVMPSFNEGTPNSVVEAMAHGKPIIASEVGGIPDMIGDEAGVLVPAGDTDALTAAMLRLAQDPMLCQRMGKAALIRYRQLFSPKAVLPLILETYRRVAGNGTQTAKPVAVKELGHPWANLPG